MSIKEKTGIIYKATSPSNKVYIGQTIISLQKRKRSHKSKAKTPNTKFEYAIQKYGIDNFEWSVLHKANEGCLDLLEQKEIEKHNSFQSGYNGTLGGKDGGFRGKVHSEKTKNSLSIMQQGKDNSMYGKKGSLNPFYGKRHSEDSRNKMNGPRDSLAGINNPMYGKGGFKDKKHSKKTINKMQQNAVKRRRDKYGKFIKLDS